jgi:hypothetical protein
VVRHQNIGVDGAAISQSRFAKPLGVADIVVTLEENRLFVVSALDDVENLIGREIAAKTGHGSDP